MAIGIVSYWFNRGQATVGRYIRSIFDDLGIDTHVLARPSGEKFVLPTHVSTSDVWAQQGVTLASGYEINVEEYRKWVNDNNITMVFFDQNYQFDAIRSLRSEGIVTIGRFVWEAFGEQHVAEAREAYTVIYSLTRCEQERYAGFGIDSPYLPWGCHPELHRHRKMRVNQGKTLLYVGGFMSTRKPTAAAVSAFRSIPDPSLRLIIKSQRSLKASDFVIPETFAEVRQARKGNVGEIDLVRGDPRIVTLESDLIAAEYFDLFASCDVALAPSRWEGLGLHLYEALALGVPLISCDIPPINEVITHGADGLLVECRSIGKRKSGITIYEPSITGLRDAIRAISDPVLAAELASNTEQGRRRWSWDKTKAAYCELAAIYGLRDAVRVMSDPVSAGESTYNAAQSQG